MFYSHRILTTYFKDLHKLNTLYLTDIKYGAYYKLENLVNNSISLEIGFKTCFFFVLLEDGTFVPKHFEDTTLMFLYN
jgi:hypothetical protein